MGGSSKQTQTTKNKTDINSITPGLQPLLDAMVSKASWISNGGQKVLNPATGQMEDQINPFITPAAANADQQNAYQGVRDMQGQYADMIAQAIGLQKDAMTRAGRAPTQEDIDPYKNLYLQNVLGDTVRAMQENSDRNMRDIGAQGALTKSFGGSRQALLESQNLYNTTRGIGEETNRVNADSFTSALSNYLNSIGLRSNMSGAGMDRVSSAQNERLKELAALENVGMTRQALEQKNLDQQGNEWLRLQDLPYKQLGALATASGAFPYQALDNTQTTTVQTKNNPLNQILGLATTAAGMFMPGAGAAGAALGAGGVGAGSSMLSGGLGGLLSGIWGKKEGGYINPLESAVKKKYAKGGMVKDPNGFDIDTNRPVVNNEDGSVSTESTITIGIDDKYYNVPTVYNGIRYPEDTAAELAKMQLKNGVTFPNFKTEEEAISAAKARSSAIGKAREFAYGGRVGNPFTQSYSSEVISNTQNPYSGIDTNIDAGATMAAVNNNSGSSALPGQNEMVNPLVNAITPLVSNTQPPPNMGMGGSPIVNMMQPVSPELLMPQNTGGNPVAQLLGMFRDGLVRSPQNGMAANVGLDGTPVQGFAQGGTVQGNPMASLFGGQPQQQAVKKPKSPWEILSDPMNLVQMGIAMMTSDKDTIGAVGEAMGSVIAAAKAEEEAKAQDPMKQYMDMLKIQQLEDKIRYASEDQALQEEMQAVRLEQIMAFMGNMGADNARANASLQLQYEEAAARQARWETEQALREKTAKEKSEKAAPTYNAGAANDTFSASKKLRYGTLGQDDPVPDINAVESDLQTIEDNSLAQGDLETARAAKAERDALAALKAKKRKQQEEAVTSLIPGIISFTK